MTTSKPSVLFVCVHNAGRSQMAAGYLTHFAGNRIDVRSAGSAPADKINPVAVAAMAEDGIDISTQTPKILTTESVQASDVVITMAAATPVPSSPGSVRKTGNSRTRPGKASTPSGKSATTSAPRSRL